METVFWKCHPTLVDACAILTHLAHWGAESCPCCHWWWWPYVFYSSLQLEPLRQQWRILPRTSRCLSPSTKRQKIFQNIKTYILLVHWMSTHCIHVARGVLCSLALVRQILLHITKKKGVDTWSLRLSPGCLYVCFPRNPICKHIDRLSHMQGLANRLTPGWTPGIYRRVGSRLIRIWIFRNPVNSKNHEENSLSLLC